MRPYEIILVAALFAFVLLHAFAMRTAHAAGASLTNLAAFALLLALAALGLHASLEGAHWQMYAAYLALLPCAILAWSAYRTPGRHHWFVWTLSLVLLVISCVCSYVVPMFRLTRPTGPYAVGTSILYMVDNDRFEDDSAGAGRKRELMVQLWYPAVPGSEKRAPYRRREETTRESSYQAVLPTNSRLDAPVLPSTAPYPVLLFNPSWNGRRTQNTFLTEELASHGYIVASIDHTYNSQPVAFPDGRVVWAKSVPAIEFMVNTTPLEVEQIGNRETDKQAADDRFVLDELARLNQQQGSPWFNAMDTANAGAVGHSLGGAVSVESWATDSRIHAAINMDGWQFGSHSSAATRAVATPAGRPGQPPPLLFLYESVDNTFNASPPNLSPGKTSWTRDEIESAVSAWDLPHIQQLVEHYGGYALILQDSIHPTFLDKTITSPLKRLSGADGIDPRRAHLIIRDYCVQFFDQALRGKPSPLLNGATHSYAEITTQLQSAGEAQASQKSAVSP